MSQLRWFVSIIIDSLCLTWLQVCLLFQHSPMAFLLCLISLPPQLLSTDFKWLGLNSLMVGWSLVELHWSCAAGDPLTLLLDHHLNPTNSESFSFDHCRHFQWTEVANKDMISIWQQSVSDEKVKGGARQHLVVSTSVHCHNILPSSTLDPVVTLHSLTAVD